MRKYYIDNLRWMSILLLLPFHTCMIYNSFGENFYIKSAGIPLLSDFIYMTNPWFMPLLFVIAGMSSCYALNRRTAKEYLRERVYKLLIPLVSGILLLVPIQTFYAEKYHNGYSGGYFEQYILFFTKKTDLTGYTGGFTPAHLWFILYLFIISLIALPIALKYKNSSRKIPYDKLSIFKLLTMFLIYLFMSLIPDIAGKSLGEYFALFMLGYLILSNDTIQEKLERSRVYLFLGFIGLTIINLLILNLWGYDLGKVYEIFRRIITWIGILSIIGMGKHYLDFKNKVTDYFSKASFPIYYFHQSYIVLAAYYTLKITSSIPIQVISIICVSFILTMLTYEIFKKIFITRFLFGIKK